MFDIFPKALSSVASFLFPLFASYKALKTSDPAQLTPWLMYWVVLACALLVESWLDWFLVWIPFYAYMRLLFLLYLVLPQTQGARHLYQTQIHPFLDDNEAAIEDFIASAHDRLRSAGMAYLKQAIEALRTRLLGLPPSPEQEAAAAGVQNARAAPQSYTQNLLARFSLPAARWSGDAGAGAANAGQDFYSLLAGAVSAAATGLAGAAGATGGATGLAGMAGGGSLIPDNIGESERADFIATQRERLGMLMRALDREAAQMGSARAAGAATGSEQPRFGDPWSQGDREQTPTASGTGGLTKSRGEAEFEKIEAESGEEGEQVRKRGTPGTGGGSWMPWGWSGGDTGKSSGVEK